MSQFKRYMEIINEGRGPDKVSRPLEKTPFEKRKEKKQMEMNRISDYQKPKTYPWDGTPKKTKKSSTSSGGYDSSANTFNSHMTSDDYGYGPKNTESDYEKKLKKDKATADYYNSQYAEKGLAIPGTEKELFKKARKYINEKNKKMLELLEKHKHTVLADIPINDLKNTIKEIEEN